MRNKKTAKPRFELLTGGGSRARGLIHADEARAKCASIASRRVLVRQDIKLLQQQSTQPKAAVGFRRLE